MLPTSLKHQDCSNMEDFFFLLKIPLGGHVFAWKQVSQTISELKTGGHGY